MVPTYDVLMASEAHDTPPAPCLVRLADQVGEGVTFQAYDGLAVQLLARLVEGEPRFPVVRLDRALHSFWSERATIAIGPLAILDQDEPARPAVLVVQLERGLGGRSGAREGVEDQGILRGGVAEK